MSSATTGLPNKALLAERLDRMHDFAARYGRSFAILAIDLDHFKPVNDTLGHPVGDQVLCEVARRLERILRRTDTIARTGGDEFVAILSEIESSDIAYLVGRKIIESVGQPIPTAKGEVQVGCSVGVAVFPDSATTAAALLEAADAALYRAKRAGRNRVE